MSMIELPNLEGMRRLLEHSLVAWRVIGRVDVLDAATITIDCFGRIVTVAAVDIASPFRWMVTCDGRTRPAVSVLAVLRQVRAYLDRQHAPGRLRVVGQVDPGRR